MYDIMSIFGNLGSYTVLFLWKFTWFMLFTAKQMDYYLSNYAFSDLIESTIIKRLIDVV